MDSDDAFDDPTNVASQSLANWQKGSGDDEPQTRPFESVSLTLATNCGAIPLGSFLSGEYQDLDLNYHQRRAAALQLQLRINTDEAATKEGQVEKAGGEPLSSSAVEPEGDCPSLGQTPTGAPSLPSSLTPSEPPLPPQEALDVLHQICLRLTGTDQALDFDIVEAQPQSKNPFPFLAFLYLPLWLID